MFTFKTIKKTAAILPYHLKKSFLHLFSYLATFVVSIFILS